MTDQVVVEKTEEERQAEAIATAQASKDAAAAAGNDTPIDAIVPDAPVKPEHVPEKFWNAESGDVNYEAWTKAHNELETKFHQKDGNPQDDSQAGDDAGSQAASDDGNNDAITSARTEYAEKGELTDATYKSLEAAGMDRSTVDSYIAGVVAQSAETNSAAYAAAEGEENYASMVKWAADGDNLTDAQIKAFNLQVSSGDAEVIAGAVKGMYAQYRETVPVEGDRLGGGAPPSSGRTFESKAEMTQAQNVPNPNIPGKTMYETDPAYRNEVIRKIAASRKAGKNIFV